MDRPCGARPRGEWFSTIEFWFLYLYYLFFIKSFFRHLVWHFLIAVPLTSSSPFPPLLQKGHLPWRLCCSVAFMRKLYGRICGYGALEEMHHEVHRTWQRLICPSNRRDRFLWSINYSNVPSWCLKSSFSILSFFVCVFPWKVFDIGQCNIYKIKINVDFNSAYQYK